MKFVENMILNMNKKKLKKMKKILKMNLLKNLENWD